MGETLPARLARLREAKGLSLRELAVPAGVHYATISRIETGDRRASLEMIRALAAPLGVSPEYLETGVDQTGTDEIFDRLARRGHGDLVVGRPNTHHPRHEGEVFVRWNDSTFYGPTLTAALRAAMRSKDWA